MEEKRFQRRREDFTCLNCGKKIKGDGFTDHCSDCLWSRHVDVNPGDRKAECGGEMEPVGAEHKQDGYIIFYQCTRCGYNYRVKSAVDDNVEEIIKISKKPIL